LGLFILLSAYIATVLFRHAIYEYEDYRTSLLNLFVLLTTANNPNVWAGAYTADRRAFFFFFTYLVVGLFFLMNLVFTVIYSNYKAQVRKIGHLGDFTKLMCLYVLLAWIFLF
jgi:two pore calcium channel protein